ncbi:Peroxisome biogenesis protein 19-1 [Cyphellophora attinorum]|uniref:Peroxisome biogenesis protein 19-1 n=1 Tax=Cyphellophora attinorum TaxID=1664694 RepID=A0A0N1HJC3_9EURO|nr:Peroxisome biogenesis protein 19-1 [Phialophora attinorum]KPI36500.1 Peroxisome biogenesis protein 19-1 [Phialophora attinorum]
MASEAGRPAGEPEKSTASVPSTIPPSQSQQDDSDPDFDDLDDVLDQFSSNAPSSSQAQPATKPPLVSAEASGPGRPSASDHDIPIPDGPREGESEEDFMKRLTAELSSAMSAMASGVPDDASKATPEDLAKMGKDLEEFTLAMEKEGIQPEDLLKAILGEQEGAKLAAAAHEDATASLSKSPSQSKTTSPQPASSKATSSTQPPSTTSFDETIRRTMERMSSSSAAATSATQSKASATSEEDMLADLLKSLGPNPDGSQQSPDDLSAMFLSMMQQLTAKSMLYEPMKDLDSKFPGWLDSNRSKLKKADLTRYEKQQVIVKEIVGKFEEKGYSDDKTQDRDFVWEKMQAMQELGAPPEDLVEGGGLMPGMGDLGGMGELLGGGGGKDEGCPTQ